MAPTIRVFENSDELAHAAAVEIEKVAVQCVAEKGAFSIALSGGSTPKKLYKMLADRTKFPTFPWGKTDFFYGDERSVPPDHADSNFRMSQETLFSSQPDSEAINKSQIHRIIGEGDPEQSAALYQAELAKYFGAETIPTFDLVLLGMGDDGHTASLFPGSPKLHETEKWVVANWVEKFKTFRITFSFPVINHAKRVFFLIAGPDKTQRIHEILGSSEADKAKRVQHPIEQVNPVAGETVWWLDKAAAAKLAS